MTATKQKARETEEQDYKAGVEALKVLNKGIGKITSSKSEKVFDNTLGVFKDAYTGYFGAKNTNLVASWLGQTYGEIIGKSLEEYLQNPLENLGVISKMYQKVFLNQFKAALPKFGKFKGTALDENEEKLVEQEKKNLEDGALAQKTYSKMLEESL
jgi:hypothetical protein